LKNYKFAAASNDTSNEGEEIFTKSSKSYWFPFKCRENTQKIQDEIENFIQQLEHDSTNNPASSVKRTSKITLIRLQSNLLLPLEPHHKQHKINYFLCHLKNSFLENQNLDTHDLKWMSLSQMKQAAKTYKLMGLEPLQIFKKYVDSAPSLNNDVDIYYEPKVLNVVENQVDQALLSSAKFSPSTVDYLFRLFYSYAFPSENLNIVRFRHLLGLILNAQKEMQRSNTAFYGGLTSKFNSYFYSFDAQQKFALSFSDFLLGWAAMEPTTQHGGVPAEQRCRYIYRFYTFSEIPLTSMGFEQFKCLTADISRAKKLNANEMTPSWLENETLNGYKVFGLKNKSDSLSLSEFLVGVGQLKFRGTSVLFRLNKTLSDILIHLTRDVNESSMQVDNEEESPQQQQLSKLHRVSSTYELATHTVKVKRSGTLVDITRLWDLEEATTPTAFKLKNDLFSLAIADDLSKPQFDRIQSIDFFNQCSQPNEMLTGLRYFERAIKTSNDVVKESFSWGKVDMETMGRCLIVICKNLQEIISLEDRLVQISAPCYILGNY